MGKLIDLPVETTLDTNPDKVLEAAKGELEDVFVVGFHKGSNRLYMASSTSDLAKCNILLDLAKLSIITECCEDDGE